MAVETHDSLVTKSSLAKLVALTPDVAILWDTHNAWRLGGQSPAQLWPEISQNVVHIYVKDSVSRPSSTPPYTYVLPGDGEFAMEELMEALAGGYHGMLSLEWERQWHPTLPPLADALAFAQESKWW